MPLVLRASSSCLAPLEILLAPLACSCPNSLRRASPRSGFHDPKCCGSRHRRELLAFWAHPSFALCHFYSKALEIENQSCSSMAPNTVPFEPFWVWQALGERGAHGYKTSPSPKR